MHIFREENIVVDSLANEVMKSQGIKEFHSFQQLPTHIRRLVNMDKSHIPHIRIKTHKIIP